LWDHATKSTLVGEGGMYVAAVGSRTASGSPLPTRAPAWLAWSLCGLALVLLAATLLVLLAGRPPPTSVTDAWQREAADLLSFVGAPLLGGLIAARRPDNRYGWLWLAFGLGLAAIAFTSAYAGVALASSPSGLPGLALAAWGNGLAFAAVMNLFPFLFLLFPTGRLPSRRWRPWAWAVVAAGGLMLLAAAFGPGTAAEGVANPLGAGGWLGGIFDRVVDPGFAVLAFATALSAFSLLLRFRHARGVERQQLKWFAYGAALMGVFLVSPAFGLEDYGLVDLLLGTLALSGVYAGIGIAVLRYRLYDIDRLINRTLVYGLLTALLGGTYAGLVLAFGQVLGRSSSLAVAIATLATAAVFRPARRRIQAVVDRRFNRRRYDAAQTIQAFSTRLRDEVDLDTLSAELLAVIDQTMEPVTASLWLRPPTDRARPLSAIDN
jgi:hypothetical protein